MAIQITYSDIDVDLARNSFTGDASAKRDLNAIRQSIQNILLTRRGERPFVPAFGSDIDSFLFESPNSFFTTVTLKNRIREKINAFDPRVKYEDFEIVDNLTDDNTLTYELKYTVKTLGQELSQGDTTVLTDGITITVERT